MVFVFAAVRLLHNRSRCLGMAAIALGFLVAGQTGALAAGEADIVELRSGTGAGSVRQVRAVVESEGKLKLNADGPEVKHLPLKVAGELVYAERVLSQSKNWTDVRLARSYLAGSANIRLHESDLRTELRPQRRLIVLESGVAGATVFSPTGPLMREELDLLEPPASGLALEALLPQRAMKIGSQWTVADGLVVRLLGLEAVSQHDVAATLESAKDGVALISLAGKVAGAVGGVSSDSELKAKLNFDLKRRAVTWFTLAVKENRAIGHAKPGFEVVTTVRMIAEPVRSVAALEDKALAGLPLKAGPGEKLLEMTSEAGGFALHHDRRWSVMLERPDLCVLRFVDRGDLIAQCNITPRPALPAGQALTMEGFQEDVKRVLGDNFEEIVEATEEADDAGRRLLCVVVAGKAGELPIQWTYFDVSDGKGRHASLVFTIEASLLERFAAIDRELIGGFAFVDEKGPTVARGKSDVVGNRE